jgi:cold shock protein
MYGIVKWFSPDKGYGFITPDEGDKDIFTHWKSIRAEGFKTLKEGDKVEFEVSDTPKGQQAENVRVIEYV